jgi:uncharacterized protein YcnI
MRTLLIVVLVAVLLFGAGAVWHVIHDAASAVAHDTGGAPPTLHVPHGVHLPALHLPTLHLPDQVSFR